jgi:hypothetical protein
MEDYEDEDELMRELMEDDLMDDEFLENYKEKRLQEMEKI